MSPSRLILIAGLVLAACQGSFFQPAVAAATFPPLPAGLARIYFYRDWEPYESLSRPQIYLNGAPAAVSDPGGVSYRDVPPGEYHVSVDTQGMYPHQFKDLTLRPGDIQYVKIESLSSWIAGGGRHHDAQRDTFVVELIPAQQAESEILDKRYVPGTP